MKNHFFVWKFAAFFLGLAVFGFGCKSVSVGGGNGDSDLDFAAAFGTFVKMPTTCAPHIPGGEYSQTDIEQEKAYCRFQSGSHNMTICPKTNSTSAGLNYVFDASCYKPKKWFGSLKFYHSQTPSQTAGSLVNPSGLAAYYHFARLIRAHAYVPPTIFVRITGRDADILLENAKNPPAGRSSPSGKSWLTTADTIARRSGRILDADGATLVGAFVNRKSDGEFGDAILSKRKAAWGKPQHAEWGRIPAFEGLRSRGDFGQAVEAAMNAARAGGFSDPGLLGPGARKQMAFWMAEMLDVVILDYLLGQQDRVGNLAYIEKNYNGLPLRQTLLADNDGSLDGGEVVKAASILDGIEHFTPAQATGIMDLAAAVTTRQGDLWRFITTEMRMVQPDVKRITTNTQALAGKLRALCAAGKLKLDVNPEEYFRRGATSGQDCKTLPGFAVSTPTSPKSTENDDHLLAVIGLPASPEPISSCLSKMQGACMTLQECRDIGAARGELETWVANFKNAKALYGSKNLEHVGDYCAGEAAVKCCYPN